MERSRECSGFVHVGGRNEQEVCSSAPGRQCLEPKTTNRADCSVGCDRAGGGDREPSGQLARGESVDQRECEGEAARWTSELSSVDDNCGTVNDAGPEKTERCPDRISLRLLHQLQVRTI